MAASAMMNPTVWMMSAIFLIVLNLIFVIFYAYMFVLTHLKSELKAFFTGTPLALFFQNNKTVEIKPITPINGIVQDKKYGPFLVTNTYVDKRTKNILMPFDVDMDVDRTVNVKQLTREMSDVITNEKMIASMRKTMMVLNQDEIQKRFGNNVMSLVSHITFNDFKRILNSASPHKIKEKIEKLVSQRISTYGTADPMQAIMLFGAIFGMTVIAAILLSSTGVS